MIMIREILVATDFSDSSAEALRVAVDHARQFGARLHIVHVSRNGDPHGAYELSRLAQGFASRQLTVTTAHKFGEAAECILDHARRAKVDLIVMGTHGRTGVTRALLGSVAERVTRRAPCPVLTVPMSVRSDVAEPAAEDPPALQRCLTCTAYSADLICTACRARIRGEALQQKRELERKGRDSV
jgi:nucleotide-binding universal stress UspA family protein